MRIMYVIGRLDRGGAELHLLNVLPRLKRLGLDVCVFALNGRGELAGQLVSSGVPVINGWDPVLAFYAPAFLRRLSKVFIIPLRLWVSIVRFRPDVLHMFLPAAYLIGGIVSFLAPVKNRIMSRRSRNFYQRKYPLLGSLERFLHRRMDALLANSVIVSEDLYREGADPNRTRILYNGWPAVQESKVRSTNNLRSMIGVSPGTLVIAMTANLIPYKGHTDLIDALERVKGELPDGWVLLCLGEDRGIGRQLAEHAQAKGLASQIRWLGSRDDVSDILSMSDIGVLCSHEEGFSNSLLEYMAAGLPSVVTDVGGNTEAVIDGVTGIVVPPHNPQALASAIHRLLLNPLLRQQMGSSARQRFINNFEIETCVENYYAVYSAIRNMQPLPRFGRLPQV